MRDDIKRRWVDALRSGEYAQGQERLRVNDEFCCLGVLCDLAAKDGVVRVEDEIVDGEERRIYYYGDGKELLSDLFLPASVRIWAGLDDDNPRVLSDDASSLASLNDSGYSFLDIAEIIQEQL